MQTRGLHREVIEKVGLVRTEVNRSGRPNAMSLMEKHLSSDNVACIHKRAAPRLIIYSKSVSVAAD